MKRVQNCSQQLTDEDLEQLLPTLLLHLVDRCGGEVVFSTTDVQSVQSCLNEKMIQMLVGDDIRLRIITRGARAKETHLESEGGRTVYEVELVDNTNNTRTVWIDAQSGRIVKTDK